LRPQALFGIEGVLFRAVSLYIVFGISYFCCFNRFNLNVIALLCYGMAIFLFKSALLEQMEGD